MKLLIMIILLTRVVFPIEYEENHTYFSPGVFFTWSGEEKGFGVNVTVVHLYSFALYGGGVGLEYVPKRKNFSFYTEVEGGCMLIGSSAGATFNVSGVDSDNKPLEFIDPYVRPWVGLSVYYSKKISMYSPMKNVCDIKVIPAYEIYSGLKKAEEHVDTLDTRQNKEDPKYYE